MTLKREFVDETLFVPNRKKQDISDSEEDEQEKLPLGLKPLPSIKKCKVKAISEDTNEEYTYDSIPEAALDLKIYARMIHHALDEENQTLFSKSLNQRFFFYKLN